MNLYLTKAGQYAGTMKDAGKGHMAVDVPTDKQGLIVWLNHLQKVPARCHPEGAVPITHPYGEPHTKAPESPVEPMGGDQALPLPYGPDDDYQTPLTARTVIAGIDAGMVSQAVRQFDGPNLAKVVTATIERMQTLATELPSI